MRLVRAGFGDGGGWLLGPIAEDDDDEEEEEEELPDGGGVCGGWGGEVGC